MFGNYSYQGVSHATCAFCVRGWDKSGLKVTLSIDDPMSIDAARHVVETLYAVDSAIDQAKISCTTKGHDYQECWSVEGYRRGTLAQTTLVKQSQGAI